MAGGLNLYGYAGGDPVNFSDPFGLCAGEASSEGDTIQTRYAHASEICVEKGDEVEAGQVIGKTGDTGNATGPVLHFETRLVIDPRFGAIGNDQSVPIDPIMGIGRLGVDLTGYGSRLTSQFGPRNPNVGAGSFHNGVDFGVPIGTPFRAAAAGTVVYVGRQKNYGLVVYINHNRP